MDESSGSYPSIEVLRDAPARLDVDVVDLGETGCIGKENSLDSHCVALFTPPPMLFAPLKTSTPKFYAMTSTKHAVVAARKARVVATKSEGGAVRKNGGGAARKSEGGAAGKNEGGAARKSEGGAARKNGGGAVRKNRGGAARKNEGGAARKSEGGAAGKNEGGAVRKNEGGAARKSEGEKVGVASTNKEMLATRVVNIQEKRSTGTRRSAEPDVGPNRMGNRVGKKDEVQEKQPKRGTKEDGEQPGRVRNEATKRGEWRNMKLANAKAKSEGKDNRGRDRETGMENKELVLKKGKGGDINRRSGKLESLCSGGNNMKLMTSSRIELHPLRERPANLHWDSTESTLMNQLMDFDEIGFEASENLQDILDEEATSDVTSHQPNHTPTAVPLQHPSEHCPDPITIPIPQWYLDQLEAKHLKRAGATQYTVAARNRISQIKRTGPQRATAHARVAQRRRHIMTQHGGSSNRDVLTAGMSIRSQPK